MVLLCVLAEFCKAILCAALPRLCLGATEIRGQVSTQQAELDTNSDLLWSRCSYHRGQQCSLALTPECC